MDAGTVRRAEGAPTGCAFSAGALCRALRGRRRCRRRLETPVPPYPRTKHLKTQEELLCLTISSSPLGAGPAGTPPRCAPPSWGPPAHGDRGGAGGGRHLPATGADSYYTLLHASGLLRRAEMRRWAFTEPFPCTSARCSLSSAASARSWRSGIHALLRAQRWMSSRDGADCRSRSVDFPLLCGRRRDTDGGCILAAHGSADVCRPFPDWNCRAL